MTSPSRSFWSNISLSWPLATTRCGALRSFFVAGNIRELRNVVTKAAILARGESVYGQRSRARIATWSGSGGISSSAGCQRQRSRQRSRSRFGGRTHSRGKSAQHHHAGVGRDQRSPTEGRRIARHIAANPQQKVENLWNGVSPATLCLFKSKRAKSTPVASFRRSPLRRTL